MTVLEIARLFSFVRELPDNRGQRVEAIQTWCGGKPGDSWCCDFVTMVLDLYYQGQSPIPRTGSCDDVLRKAKALGLIVSIPIPGDVYLRLNSPTDAHHAGFVTSPVRNGRFGQISGNTSKDGLSSNGDGVYERDVPLPAADKIAFVRLPARVAVEAVLKAA